MKKNYLKTLDSFEIYMIKILIGLILLCLVLLLCNCQSPAKPVNRPTITCIERIQTNADMASCLAEYDTKYGE